MTEIRIAHTEEPVAGFRLLTFDRETTGSLPYVAGQYLTLVEPVTGARRSYSMTSAPALGELLTIGVRRVANGLFSRYLVDTVKVGDSLYTTGTGGLFTLPAEEEALESLWFWAAGSGITPVFSLLKTALHTTRLRSILVYSSPAREQTVFLDELLQLQRQFEGRLLIEFLFSNNLQLARARLHRDLFLELLQQYLSDGYGQTKFYTCGPESYMRMCTYILQELQVPPAQIRREAFLVRPLVQKPVPPDKGAHPVTVLLPGASATFTVQYPDTILQAARRQGLFLPYSCEAGSCGNCVLQCTEGKVWMAQNEVLTVQDLQQGLVLTCTGFPLNGAVTLQAAPGITSSK